MIKEILISGYGTLGNPNIIKCDLEGKIIWSDTIESPSFVITSGEYMFTLTENSDYGIIYLYIKDGNGYQLNDQLKVSSTALCHLSYSPIHHMLFVSSWGSGDLIYLKVDNNRFSFHQIIHHEPFNNLISRVHFSYVSKDESKLYVNNVGLDIIYTYEISDNGLKEINEIHLPLGNQPRHLCFNDDESMMYVITEMSNKIIVIDIINHHTIQVISTLPNNNTGKSNCSSIVINHDKQVIYAANRYSETIVTFKILDNHKLEMIHSFICHGVKPRHMELINNQLFIAYQTSGEIYIYDIDNEGILHVNHRIEHPGASGIAKTK